MFQKGLRDDFFKVWNRQYGSSNDIVIRKLEFEYQTYFCVYAIHPMTRKSNVNSIDKVSLDHYKKYLQAKGSELSQTTEFLHYFALPHIPKPLEHPAIAYIFTKQWITKLKSKLAELFPKGFQSQSQQSNKTSALQELYINYTKSVNECSTSNNCQHLIELQELKSQYADLVNVANNLQNQCMQVSQSWKQNLLESQIKWFQFSKDILNLVKRAAKGEKSEKFEALVSKYQEFLNSDVNELVNMTMNTKDVSLFQRSLYSSRKTAFTQYYLSYKLYSKYPNVELKRNEKTTCPIDLQKIMRLFQEADKGSKEVEVCLVLQALRWRFTKLPNPYARRQVILSYSMADVCGVTKENWRIQEKLLFKSSVRVRECFLRLLNYITSDYMGITYLIKEPLLVINLIKIFKGEKEDNASKKHSLGVLQKLSLLKKPQEIMMSNGILQVILDLLGKERESLTEYSLQYLTALLMNLSLRKVGREQFHKYRTELIHILYDFLLEGNAQIRNYVNGTIYSLVCSSTALKEEAMKIGMEGRMKELIKSSEEGLSTRQYQYIIDKLNSNQLDEQDLYSDDQNELDFDDIDDDEENLLSDDDKSSEYLDAEEEGREHLLNGEELLMKEYALLGPDAFRQLIMTRSALDESCIRKQNMTTSINKSRRIDVFNGRPVTPSLNPRESQTSNILR